METLYKKLNEIGVVPVIAIENLEDAIPIAKQFYDNNLKIMEITLRTTCAIEAIYTIKKQYPDMIIGVGTVINTNQIDLIKDANIDFIVSPGFNPKVVQYAQQQNIIIIPGVDSPSTIEQAIEHGIKYVKFFPAEANGGVTKLKALSGPYPQIKFMPTGGVNLKNINDYLELKNVLAVGGTFFIDKQQLTQKNYEHIANNCVSCINTILNCSVASIHYENTTGLEAIFNLPKQNIVHSNENKIIIHTNNIKRYLHYYPNTHFFGLDVEIKEKLK